MAANWFTNASKVGCWMQPTSLPTAEQKPPKLRWYQWRLRSLFLLTLLVAIGMSWLAVEMQDERKQKVAADAIVKAGGKVTSEQTWLGKLLRDDSLVRVTSVESTPDAGPVHLEGLDHLQTLWLQKTQVTDAGLVHLQGLNQLKGLSLNNTKITDAGMVYLQGLSQLQVLWLNDTKITNAGMVYLQGLSQLESLELNNTKITDAGLVHLRGLSQLGRLNLSQAEITDAGLVHLQGLRQLALLILTSTKVTDLGVKKLQQALPKCKIVTH